MKHPVDVGAMAAYIAGGGLGAVFAFMGAIYPAHAAQFVGAGTALVAIAGAVRVVFNRTPPSGTTAVVTSQVPPTPASLSANAPLAAPPQKDPTL